MMGHRSRLICGDEHDAFTGFRRLLAWRAGERRAIKQAHNRRERKRQRLALLAGLVLAASARGQGLPAPDDPRWVHVGPLRVLAQTPQPYRGGPFLGVWPAPGVRSLRCELPGSGTLLVDGDGAHWTDAASGIVTRQLPVAEACDRCKGIPDLSLRIAPAAVLRLRSAGRDSLVALPRVVAGRQAEGATCRADTEDAALKGAPD